VTQSATTSSLKEGPVQVTDRIRSFIEQEVVPDSNVHLAHDTPLLDGILDSLALMQLVAFLEEEFETEIDDSAVTADNFRTIGDIERLVGDRAAGV
jgi:acyl carrier protein